MSKLLKDGVRQKGFTLIEMSIVLVIIGLIIGGILKGQEIIDASRQKNFITQIDSIRAAVNTFSDKYQGVPGDYNRATTRINAQAVDGDGDGVVGVVNTTFATVLSSVAVGAGPAATAVAGLPEQQNFFCQLSQANLIGGTSSDCSVAASFFGAGSPLPATAYAQSGIDVVFGPVETADTKNTVTALWARVHRGAGAAITQGASGVISGRALSQIDFKYDDGLPGLGQIRSAFDSTSVACPIGTGAAVYKATSDAPDCAVLIRLVQ
jgi:prepilin-type N-terminal cleavage/methylation domain-containing protein